MSSNRGTTCSAAMELFHRVLDGDLMEATDRQGMQAHLAVCSECAEKAGQLREMQDLLRGMAERPMPDQAMREVWQCTVRAPGVRTRHRWRNWRFAAAAAVVIFVTWTAVRLYPVPGDDREALRAAQEVRMVLQLTANALRRTEEVTFRKVFAEEVSPALRKVGILWPRAPRGRDGSEG